MERQHKSRDPMDWLPLPEMQGEIQKDNEKLKPADMADTTLAARGQQRKEQRMKEVFKKYAAVVFFDTETTGLDAKTCQIIELAAIRIEQTEHGTLRMANHADIFVKLPEGQQIPEKIVELTGITDETLEAEGVTEAEAAAIFTDMIRNDKGPVLLVAHNAQSLGTVIYQYFATTTPRTA